MKSIVFATLLLATLAACNNGSEDHSQHMGNKQPKTQIDSLEQQIDEGHIVGMSKMARLTRLQQRTKAMVDSLEKLPAKAKQAALPYKQKLEALLKDLDYADFAMTKWMNEYQMDSLVNDTKARAEYLLSEKNKVDKVKSAILNSLERADSIFLK